MFNQFSLHTWASYTGGEIQLRLYTSLQSTYFLLPLAQFSSTGKINTKEGHDTVYNLG